MNTQQGMVSRDLRLYYYRVIIQTGLVFYFITHKHPGLTASLSAYNCTTVEIVAECMGTRGEMHVC